MSDFTSGIRHRFRAMIFFILIILFAPIHEAFCAIHEVSPGELIQSAVNEASDGDTVLLNDGVYMESVVLDGRALVIASRYILDFDSTHLVNTIVIPSGAVADTFSCFIIANNENAASELHGLTLMEGEGTLWNSGDGPMMAGGAVFARNSRITIRSCIISESSADWGGGIGIVEPDTGEIPECSIVACKLYDNNAAAEGGGLYAYHSKIHVVSSKITDCTAGAFGGAVSVVRWSLSMDSCEIRSCGASALGGVMCAGTSDISDCIFDGNYGASMGGTSHITLLNSRGTVTRCIFRNSNVNCHALEFHEVDTEHFRFVGNVVEDNLTTTLVGTVLITRSGAEYGYNIFRNNYSQGGGCIYILHYPYPYIHHNVFLSNLTDPEFQGSRGSVIDILPNVNFNYPLIENNIFEGNPGNSCSNEDEEYYRALDVRNNWWGHVTGPYHPTMNPLGQGDTLTSDSILFIPWLTEAPDTTMPESAVEPTQPAMPGTWQIMNLYPNPFNSEFRIILAGFAGSDFKLALYDILGREAAVIHQGAITGGQVLYQAPPELSSGVYFLRAADRNQMDTRKVIFLK